MDIVGLETLKQEQIMHYVMIKPEPLTAAWGQQGAYVVEKGLP